MLLDIIIEIQGIHSYEQICPLADSCDKVLIADHSDPRAAQVGTLSEWENECGDILECCGIVSICDVGS